MKKTFCVMAMLASAGGFALTAHAPGYAASAGTQAQRSITDTRYEHFELSARGRWRCWWRHGERWCGWW